MADFLLLCLRLRVWPGCPLPTLGVSRGRFSRFAPVYVAGLQEDLGRSERGRLRAPARAAHGVLRFARAAVAVVRAAPNSLYRTRYVDTRALYRGMSIIELLVRVLVETFKPEIKKALRRLLRR